MFLEDLLILVDPGAKRKVACQIHYQNFMPLATIKAHPKYFYLKGIS